MKRTANVNVRMEPEFAAKLKRLAQERHQTVSQLVRMVAEQWASKRRVRRVA